MENKPEWLKRLMSEPNVRRVANRLDSHLGCISCRGELDDGRCPACDPAEDEGE